MRFAQEIDSKYKCSQVYFHFLQKIHDYLLNNTEKFHPFLFKSLSLHFGSI